MIMEWQIMLLKIYPTVCVEVTYAGEISKDLETYQKRKSSNIKASLHHIYRKWLKVKPNDL